MYVALSGCVLDMKYFPPLPTLWKDVQVFSVVIHLFFLILDQSKKVSVTTSDTYSDIVYNILVSKDMLLQVIEYLVIDTRLERK